MIQIRQAQDQDGGPISQIWNPQIREGFITFNSIEKSADDVTDMIRSRLSSGFGFLVAEDKTDLLGFASYGAFRSGIGYAQTMEHTIVLAPHAQGRGVGRLLMQSLEDYARQCGINSLIAGVSGENPKGIAFHAALGYSPVAVLPRVGRKFDIWLDLHLMQKFL